MTKVLLYTLFLGTLPLVEAFQTQTQTPRRQCTRLAERTLPKTPYTRQEKKQSCDPCAEPDADDNLLDRREAAFAMLGAVWATTTTAYPAHAASGDEAKLALPNPLQGMADRVGKQCLVESLGNRECLVYMDENALLYKGADYQLLLTRVGTAYGVLKEQLPKLIEAKKWTQVTGVLTGPLGELVRTMIQITKLVDADKVAACEKQVQVVKKDLYGISAAVEKKDVTKAMAAYDAAIKDLGSFIVDYS